MNQILQQLSEAETATHGIDVGAIVLDERLCHLKGKAAGDAIDAYREQAGRFLDMMERTVERIRADVAALDGIKTRILAAG
ncbi:MAG TPA: hypothetical protein P5081_06745 [Phycisphaerae bacterium]|nr:hypothetical protein [Phycisphaerae bacterium]HRW52569.1 hypothetical protein [Phycisphaerae bacterium]